LTPDAGHKLLVGVGVTASGYTTEMEVIDLDNPDNVCRNLKEFPVSVDKSGISVTAGNLPIICGEMIIHFKLCFVCLWLL
jgi:hypothetical protein